VTLPLIYIAGPFRGPTPLDVRRNVEAARDLGLRVAQAGGSPVIPHTMTADFDKQLDDQFWLDGTMELLRRCDAIVLTNNWAWSTGARAEVEVATAIEMPVHADCGWDVNDGMARRDRMLTSFISGVRDSSRRGAFL
jgi:hypothetical protein